MVIWQLASVKCDNSWNLMHGVMLLYFSWISFYWATVAICYQTVVCPVSSVCLFVTLVYCWTDPDETWRSGRPRPWPHCVKWGPSSPSPNGGGALQFLAHVYYGQMAGWIKMPLVMEVGLGPGHIVRWGPSFPLPNGGKLGSQLPPSPHRLFYLWSSAFIIDWCCSYHSSSSIKALKSVTKSSVFLSAATFVVVMAALGNRAGYYIFMLWFLSSMYLFFSSPDLSGRTLDVYHTSTHGVALVQI